jgi:hypothetical protein
MQVAVVIASTVYHVAKRDEVVVCFPAADIPSLPRRRRNRAGGPEQGGESTALEVVDAQTTLVQARNPYDDAQTRYRVAVADLPPVTDSF